jgi:hypothetical protein
MHKQDKKQQKTTKTCEVTWNSGHTQLSAHDHANGNGP